MIAFSGTVLGDSNRAEYYTDLHKLVKKYIFAMYE